MSKIHLLGPDHLTEAAHSFSGWELHPLTAWRISNTAADFGLSANPNSLNILASQSASSTVTVDTFNLFSATSPSQPQSQPHPPQLDPRHNNHDTVQRHNRSRRIANSKLTVTTAASSLGNYTVLVKARAGI